MLPRAWVAFSRVSKSSLPIFAMRASCSLVISGADPLWSAPLITKEQEALIAKMGSDDFDTREKATQALGNMDYAGLRAMLKAQQHTDLEVRRRAECLLHDFY